MWIRRAIEEVCVRMEAKLDILVIYGSMRLAGEPGKAFIIELHHLSNRVLPHYCPLLYTVGKHERHKLEVARKRLGEARSFRFFILFNIHWYSGSTTAQVGCMKVVCTKVTRRQKALGK